MNPLFAGSDPACLWDLVVFGHMPHVVWGICPNLNRRPAQPEDKSIHNRLFLRFFQGKILLARILLNNEIQADLNWHLSTTG